MSLSEGSPAPSAADVSALKKDADALVSAVQTCIATRLPNCADQAEYRLVKHAVYAAHSVFAACPEVCASVGDASLCKLVEVGSRIRAHTF